MTKLMLFVLCGTVLVAPAANGQEKKPAPLGPPPSFVRVTEAGRDDVTIEVSVPVAVQKTGTRVRAVDGKNVTEAYTYTVTEYVTVLKKVSVADVQLRTIGGKAAEWPQAVGKVVLQAATPDGVDAAYKPLFAEGTLVMSPVKK